MLREALDYSADYHDHRATEDGPSTAKFVVYHGNEGEGEDGTQRVCRSNDALEGSLGIVEVWHKVSKLPLVFLFCSPFPLILSHFPSRIN